MGYSAGPLLGLENRRDRSAGPASHRRLGSVLRITRAENCVMAGVATLVGAGTAAVMPGPPRGPALAGSVAAVMLVLAFGNVVNDLADQEVDRLGKRRRPLPSGRISATQARWLAAALLTAALTVTLVTAPRQLAFVVAMAAVAALYSPFLKRVPLLGNAVVAGQCGATLVFGARAVGDARAATFGGALLVAVGILCVEVAKTVEDHDPDRRVGTRTVAHLVAPARHTALVGWFAASYLTVLGLILGTADTPGVLALAAVPVVPLVAFALLPSGPATPAARVPRFIVASKCLWPLALVALTGL